MKTLITIISLVLACNIFSQTKYSNEKYGFAGQVPNDWKIYAEIKDDESNNNAIIDWGLPRVYSELEKASIENAVTITAYKRNDIKNLDELMKFEFNRVADILISKELLETADHTSYLLMTSRNGHKYKNKVIFIFKNNTGYILNFSATPGTYDINLPKFDSFIKSVSFTEPKEQAVKKASDIIIRFDGLYVAKTKEITVAGNKMTIYSYIRFYDDGTVYTQSVNSYDPEKISKWFGKNGRFERKGNYKFEGNDVSFTVNNGESPDKEIEGNMADTYNGKLTDQNKLFLQVKYSSGEVKDFWFEFVKL